MNELINQIIDLYNDCREIHQCRKYIDEKYQMQTTKKVRVINKLDEEYRKKRREFDSLLDKLITTQNSGENQ